MLAFLQFQLASRDGGSHDCSAIGEHLALAEDAPLRKHFRLQAGRASIASS
jgi:hypothetical protein